MLRLSKKTILALEAVVDIALNARGEPVQSKEITRRQGIPQRYLEQVMQHLVHAGILKGVRGPRGGYRLARERRRISAGDVVRVVAQIESNEEEGLTPASQLGEKVVGPLVEKFHGKLMAELDRVTVEELCEEAERQGLSLKDKTKMDFTI